MFPFYEIDGSHRKRSLTDRMIAPFVAVGEIQVLHLFRAFRVIRGSLFNNPKFTVALLLRL